MKLDRPTRAAAGQIAMAAPPGSAMSPGLAAAVARRRPGQQVRSYVLLAIGIALFVVGTTSINWVKHVSLRSNWAFDLAYFDNIASNIAHGRTFTYFFGQAYFDVREFNGGPSVFRMDHQRWVYLALAPALYWLIPSVLSLMAMQ